MQQKRNQRQLNKNLKKKDERFAEMMINDGEPVDKIERYTGLDIDALKQIANSLGKTLVI